MPPIAIIHLIIILESALRPSEIIVYLGNAGLYALPLVAPVDNYHVASGFGIRKDPLTKRRSMHFGADLAGWIRSPVYATAPGTVVVVGRKARFGKMVEIDHGYGIRTRYGHFSKILVKKGQLLNLDIKSACLETRAARPDRMCITKFYLIKNR